MIAIDILIPEREQFKGNNKNKYLGQKVYYKKWFFKKKIGTIKKITVRRKDTVITIALNGEILSV